MSKLFQWRVATDAFRGAVGVGCVVWASTGLVMSVLGIPLDGRVLQIAFGVGAIAGVIWALRLQKVPSSS